jgi:pyrimidine-nucleoside phosphorylase
MRPQEIIEKKRDGHELSIGEIDEFVDGVCDSTWADYQISALVMAMFIQGLNAAETAELTRAMLHSGEVLDFSDIDAPKADKHSTGGVGDKTSLIIAPLVASCGVAVPMVSGRGLGHTGGTLDKLESIPGYRVDLSASEFRSVLKKNGYAMAGQTTEIAPADKKLYALRDATATVPYVPLIVGSIMSKKLAEGLDALVLDVKTGSGAFMQTLEDSTRLAKALVETGKNFGVKTEAVISDMSQPLGPWVGNAHEVYECIQILRGENLGDPTKSLSVELSARMLVLTGVSPDLDSATLLVNQKLTNGDAFDRFRKNVEMQGGDVSVCDHPEKLIDTTLAETPIVAGSSGSVSAIDTCAIGNAVAAIGGGRVKAEDTIDHAIGYASHSKIGDEVRAGDVLGIVYSRHADDPAAVQILNAYSISEENVEGPALVVSIVG